MWETLFQSAANVLIFGIAASFIKSIIDKSTNKKIESFKSDLEKELKLFQNKLELDLSEHRSHLEMLTFKNSKFHEKRLNILTELYAKLSDLNIYMHDLTAIFKTIKEDYQKEEFERMEKAKNAFNDFMFCFERNRIFIDETTCNLFQEIRSEYFGNLVKYNTTQILNKEGKYVYDLMKEIQKAMQSTIPKIREDLEKQIRRTISVIEKQDY